MRGSGAACTEKSLKAKNYVLHSIHRSICIAESPAWSRMSARNEKAALWARLDSGFKGVTPAARSVGHQARSLLHLRCGHLILDRFAVVALHAILMANHLPVELVDERVDSGIQVFMMRFDKDVLALEM